MRVKVLSSLVDVSPAQGHIIQCGSKDVVAAAAFVACVNIVGVTVVRVA